jgi:hypothetical protein
MSIQSTTNLTREEAEERLVFKLLEDQRAKKIAYVKTLSNEQIEDELESTFDNYSVRG